MAVEAAKAVQVVAAHASPFATLFKQSKFSSFDPLINQSYTTYEGNAHRGNWGFKRPLPLRTRKNGYITVKSADSRESQTEWNSAQRQVKWLKRWEESGTNAEIRENQKWGMMLGPAAYNEWRIDSDFSPEPLLADGTSDRASVPNIAAMSQRQFQAYLKKLRKLRPQFIQYLAEQTKESKDPLQVAQHYNVHAQAFIAKQTSLDLHASESRRIEQRPHRSGGLLYSHPSPLQTFLTARPQPGYVLTEARDRTNGFLVSFSGITSRVGKGDGSLRPLYRHDKVTGMQLDKDAPPGMFRLIKAELAEVPQVVGKVKQGLKGVRMTTEVRKLGPEFQVANPYPPGSRECIALQIGPRGSGRYEVLSVPRSPAAVFGKLQNRTKHAKNQTQILTTLRGIVGPGPQRIS